MNKSILIWVASAVVYLGIVVAGYSVYSSFAPQEEQSEEHTSGEVHAMQQEDFRDGEPQDAQHSVQAGDQHDAHQGEKQGTEHGDQHSHPQNDQHDAHGDHHAVEASEVSASISYTSNQLQIGLLDPNNAPPQLQLTHEKYMHLIVVSEDLKQYLHLHPTQMEDGVYVQEIELDDNNYKAFVDIKPQGLSYAVKPLELNIANGTMQEQEQAHQHRHTLTADGELNKVVNGIAVEINDVTFKANENVTLDFKIQNAIPEPYLGALGHVVILDEGAENFIHVHPIGDDVTTFSTTFQEPGLYKLWAEFQFNGTVNVYPFIIEVQ